MEDVDTADHGGPCRDALVARWAVVFDALGVAYAYSRAGFCWGARGYGAPDFWLPSQHVWAAVWGEDVSTERGAALWLTARLSQRPLWVLKGLPALEDAYQPGDRRTKLWGTQTEAVPEVFMCISEHGRRTPWRSTTVCALDPSPVPLFQCTADVYACAVRAALSAAWNGGVGGLCDDAQYYDWAGTPPTDHP
jgi:hypothetical protein